MKPSFLIVGLGNPGKQYERTRHNIGFLALDHAANELQAQPWSDQQKFLCTAAEGEIDGTSVLFVKPTTYMNRSGECIRKLVDFYRLDPTKHLLVLCDDVDLPLGTHRLRMHGGPGTHNGLRSIVDTFGEAFPRLRIGFGPQPEKIDLAAWVLSRMDDAEIKELETGCAAVVPSVREVMKTNA